MVNGLIVFLILFGISTIPDEDSVGWRIGILAVGAVPLALSLSAILSISIVAAIVIAIILSIPLYGVSAMIRFIHENSDVPGSVVAVIITSLLSTMIGLRLVEDFVAASLMEYPFFYGLSLAIPLVVGLVGLYFSASCLDFIGSPCFFWDYIKRIGCFLLTPAAIAAGVGIAILLVFLITGALATALTAALISAIVGGGGVLVIIFHD